MLVRVVHVLHVVTLRSVVGSGLATQRSSAKDGDLDVTLATAAAQPLDRRYRGGWIIVVALALSVVGCSSLDESGSALQEATARWSLSPDARTVGSGARVPYESAPLWNGGRACGGQLRSGSKSLGRELMDRFSQVKSIGGYACRRNTADSSRLSVHGTGKALDVFIPVRNGRANSELGDPVANWLVANAADIGVQLIIWNRSVWRSNGTNEKPYSGPVPHIDHLHVELTERAARKLTPWFEQRLEAEGGVDDDDAGITTTEPNVDAGDIPIAAHDAGAHPAADASADGAVAAKDAGAVPAEPATPGDDDYEPENDGPGEEDSLGTGVREAQLGATADDAPIIASCAAAPRASTWSSGSSAGLALALAAALVRRRRRSDRDD